MGPDRWGQSQEQTLRRVVGTELGAGFWGRESPLAVLGVLPGSPLGPQDCGVGQSSSRNMAWCPWMPHWPLVSVPPLQKHLSLMKCFPLRRHLAHTATRHLLSDKEGVGGQASQQVGLACRLSGLVSEPHSTSPLPLGGMLILFLCRGCARLALGELRRTPGGGERGCPSAWVSLPRPPAPLTFFCPQLTQAHVLCASPHAGPSACPVASEAQVCPQRDDKDSPGVPASC